MISQSYAAHINRRSLLQSCSVNVATLARAWLGLNWRFARSGCLSRGITDAGSRVREDVDEWDAISPITTGSRRRLQGAPAATARGPPSGDGSYRLSADRYKHDVPTSEASAHRLRGRLARWRVVLEITGSYYLATAAEEAAASRSLGDAYPLATTTIRCFDFLFGSRFLWRCFGFLFGGCLCLCSSTLLPATKERDPRVYFLDWAGRVSRTD